MVDVMNDFSQLHFELHDHVALLTMDAPPVNAVTRILNDELTMAMDQVSDMNAVRAVVLTGAGRVFCAGADIKARAAMTAGLGALSAHSRRTRECFHAIRECAKPVVCAVNGAALGAGLAIVASCDILLASDKGVFGLPEVDVGLMGGGKHAMRLFSHSRLRRMMLTGMRVEARELYRLGVIEACTQPEKLLAEALAVAQEIATKSPLATRLAKHTLNVIEDMSLRDGYRYEQDMTAQISSSEDTKEAQLAFAEKRAPIFVGR